MKYLLIVTGLFGLTVLAHAQDSSKTETVQGLALSADCRNPFSLATISVFTDGKETKSFWISPLNCLRVEDKLFEQKVVAAKCAGVRVHAIVDATGKSILGFSELKYEASKSCN